MSTIICIIIILAILTVVFDFVMQNAAALIISLIVLLIIVLIIKSNKKDGKKVQYYQYSLSQFLDLSIEEQNLYIAALKLLREKVVTFTPHEMGVRGLDTTSTYYRNLYDKGYFDKVKRGVYTINRDVFKRIHMQYINALDSRIEIANTSTWHKKQVPNVVSCYEYDKKNILADNEYRLSDEDIALIGSVCVPERVEDDINDID